MFKWKYAFIVMAVIGAGSFASSIYNGDWLSSLPAINISALYLLCYIYETILEDK